MSLDIDQIALHQLIKRDEQNLELVLRESLLEPTATVVEMMAELHRVYSAKNKAYGLFTEESAGSVKAKKSSCRSAAPLPGACVTNWQNTLLLKAGSCCFASIAIWRWNT